MPPTVVLEGSHVRLEPLRLTHVDDLARAAAQSRDTFAFTLVPAAMTVPGRPRRPHPPRPPRLLAALPENQPAV